MMEGKVGEASCESPPPSYDKLYPVEQSKLPDPLLTLLHISETPYRTYFTKHKIWPEGEGCYYGELDWKRRRAGQGKMVWASGRQVYTGHWVKNRMEGRGVIFWKGTGTYYSGQWKKGLVHGIGRLVYGQRSGTPGDVYEGEFR